MVLSGAVGIAMGLPIALGIRSMREDESRRVQGIEAARAEVAAVADPVLGPDGQLKEVIANVCDGVYRTELYETAAKELYDRISGDGALAWPENYAEAVDIMCTQDGI